MRVRNHTEPLPQITIFPELSPEPGIYARRKLVKRGIEVRIGRRAGVAGIFGVNISGFLAWWIWRTICLSKLPRLEKKLRVALDWTLDLMSSRDLCRSQEVRREKKHLKPLMTP